MLQRLPEFIRQPGWLLLSVRLLEWLDGCTLGRLIPRRLGVLGEMAPQAVLANAV